ncbi:unnamed protein product [Echinostoma caproni]|uniref:Protein polybromo-1 n=1 Tax=Echinostoma caproni TaxID=27848 RepID=A0A182ZZZ8_9TREM|nr:unnamed protein product [Echinostoma caproni]
MSSELEDPLDKHARRCGQRVFLDIIRYACDGTIPQKYSKRSRRSGVGSRRSSSYSETEEDEFEKYPPLDWEDQLTRRNVKIISLPFKAGSVASDMLGEAIRCSAYSPRLILASTITEKSSEVDPVGLRPHQALDLPGDAGDSNKPDDQWTLRDTVEPAKKQHPSFR